MGIRGTFTDKVRKAVESLGTDGSIVKTEDIAYCLDLVSGAEKKPMHSALRELVRQNEIMRVEPGRYKWAFRKNEDLQSKMWRLLRSRRVVTVDDMVGMIGASKEYAREFFQMLQRREVVKRIGESKYQMIEDPVDMPVNEEKAARLRRIRKEKALAAFDVAAKTARQEFIKRLESEDI